MSLFLRHENMISWQTTISQQQKENYLYAENKCIRVVFLLFRIIYRKKVQSKIQTYVRKFC